MRRAESTKRIRLGSAAFIMLASLLRLCADPTNVREPAVAGLFYPKDAKELSAMVDRLLASANPESVEGELKALICPHAGYRYSGPVAATAYRLLLSRRYDTVLVLAPSHYSAIDVGSVCAAGEFRTSLGDVAVRSDLAASLAKLKPFAIEAPAATRRPDWSRQASCPAPEEGEDTPHTWEHAIEVQVPFLQKTLHDFRIVPVVCGRIDPASAATALEEVLDGKVLLVVSSDLSHYDSYPNAQRRDHRTIDAICAMMPDSLASDDACGVVPIQILLHVARAKGWKAKLLDYRNSGDTTGEVSHGVVGYAAIAFYAPSEAAPNTGFTFEQRQLLLGLARQALRDAVNARNSKPIDTANVDPILKRPRGCFVTLTKDGALRGCIGNILPEQPLVESVISNTRSAALSDPRFPPVTAGEVDRLEIEISVLTEPLALEFGSPGELLEKLQPGRDGVVLQIGRRTATYLPQVWAELPDKEAFLNSLSRKAGCVSSAWRGADVKVSVYQAMAFSEEMDH